MMRNVANLNVNDCPEDLKRRIRLAAGYHGISMSEYARQVLDQHTPRLAVTTEAAQQ